jgi:hypothetical protein
MSKISKTARKSAKAQSSKWNSEFVRSCFMPGALQDRRNSMAGAQARKGASFQDAAASE